MHVTPFPPGELQLITTSTYRHMRLFLWVAQALLPVFPGHSLEWLCHFAAWTGGLSSIFGKSLREIARLTAGV
jgi:hypothetical protein